MASADWVKRLAVALSLIAVAACDPGGSAYPEHGSQTPQTTGTGVTVSGSARVGVVYGPG